MTRKVVGMTLQHYDPELGVCNGSNTVSGYTDDDGATIVLGAGYLPGLAEARPEDLVVAIEQPSVQLTVTAIAVTVDPETGDQTITLNA